MRAGLRAKLSVGIVASLLICGNAVAGEAETGRSPLLARPRDRVSGVVDDQRRTTLPGNRHPLARPEYEIGLVKPDFRMEHMVMMLKPDATQQSALEELITAQHNPDSPYYHQWITPEAYGQMFGISDDDLAQVVSWLQAQGMTIEDVTAGRRAIVFSGSAGQVASAFHTQIRTYKVSGEVHHGNGTDPQIPSALAGVVGGLASLHDFHSKPQHSQLQPPVPAFTSGGGHYLAPSDFATIYDLNPLYQQSVTGSGQSIAIVGRSNINLSDVRLFRSNFGLPANDPQIILNGADPGIVNVNEEVEADLDVEWSGAVARNAAIKFVVSASTNSSDGAFLSAQYIVNHNVAPVMSMSFGLCEVALGASGNNFLNSLWQQAAAQGITVLVSSGDSGAAGCDSSSAKTATGGKAINGLCSTPYSVCVGGTQFADAANPGVYWASSNSSGSLASALSYIPETVWNESGNSGLWSGGGGVSAYYSKPPWQLGPGVLPDGKRDVPDVSLTAAGHDGYLIYINGGLNVVGGTSAASPALAGIMALIVQATATRQGNANPAFYSLASKQASGGAAVFHDIVTGNNGVPGAAGFSATHGYDSASGLGSVDATMLAAHWADSVTVPNFQLSASVGSASVSAGESSNVTLTSSVTGGFSSTVALSVTGLPAGVTAAFTPPSLPAPGSGSSILKLSASSAAKAGAYPLNVVATASGTSKTVALSLNVSTPPNYALTPLPTSLKLMPGNAATLTLTSIANPGFAAPLNLGITGLPSGITGTFSPAGIASPGSGAVTLTLTAAANAAAGTYSPVITATGGGIVHTVTPAVNVPGISLSSSFASMTAPPGGRPTVAITVQAIGGFSSAVAFSATGLPAGATGSFSPSSLATPGSGKTTLTLSLPSATVAGNYPFVVTASGGGLTRTQALTLNVPSFILTSNVGTVSLAPKMKSTLTVTPHLVAGFSSSITLMLSGLPSGVTYSFSPATLPAPGGGTSTLTLTRTAGVTGTSHPTITAAGGGVVQTVSLTLKLTTN